MMLFRYYEMSGFWLTPFAHRRTARGTHLAVLVDHAVDAALLHGLTVVNMLRREAPVLA